MRLQSGSSEKLTNMIDYNGIRIIVLNMSVESLVAPQLSSAFAPHQTLQEQGMGREASLYYVCQQNLMMLGVMCKALQQ